MNNSLQQYIDCQKELYGREALVEDRGFIIYNIYEDKSAYVHLIYIEELSRSLGLGSILMDTLIKETGATTIYSYVDTTTKNPELALKAHLGYGFKIYTLGNNSIQMVYETKEHLTKEK